MFPNLPCYKHCQLLDIGFATFNDSKLKLQNWVCSITPENSSSMCGVNWPNACWCILHKADSLKFLVLKYNSGTWRAGIDNVLWTALQTAEVRCTSYPSDPSEKLLNKIFKRIFSLKLLTSWSWMALTMEKHLLGIGEKQKRSSLVDHIV